MPDTAPPAKQVGYATAWTWLSRHPRRDDIVKFVKGAGREPAWIDEDAHKTFIRRDRKIYSHYHGPNGSLRKTAAALNVGRMTVHTCVSVYDGKAELPAVDAGRERVAKLARRVLTAAVLESYVAGKTTFTQIMELLGTRQNKTAAHWIKLCAFEVGVIIPERTRAA